MRAVSPTGIGGGPLALAGLLLTTLATVPLGLIGAHTSIVYLSLVMFARGIGVGFAFMPTMAAAFAALRPSEITDAAPQMNMLQRVGGSIGTAVLAVVLGRALVGAHGAAAAAAAFGTAFWWSVGLTALAVLPGLVLLRAERAARATPRPATAESGPHGSAEALA